jgi:hypothetical protein
LPKEKRRYEKYNKSKQVKRFSFSFGQRELKRGRETARDDEEKDNKNIFGS